MASGSCGASITTTSSASPTIQTLLSTSQAPPSRWNCPDVTSCSMCTRSAHHDRGVLGWPVRMGHALSRQRRRSIRSASAAEDGLTMAVLLGLLAALSYGASDFSAGLGSRRLAPGPVTLMVQALAVVTALVGVVLLPGDGPAGDALAWGALAGVGSALGTLALYRGLAVGAMSPVAACSAVLAAVLPALVGLLSGDRLSFLVALGIVIALPAIALVSWSGGPSGGSVVGAVYGL